MCAFIPGDARDRKRVQRWEQGLERERCKKKGGGGVGKGKGGAKNVIEREFFLYRKPLWPDND